MGKSSLSPTLRCTQRLLSVEAYVGPLERARATGGAIADELRAERRLVIYFCVHMYGDMNETNSMRKTDKHLTLAQHQALPRWLRQRRLRLPRLRWSTRWLLRLKYCTTCGAGKRFPVSGVDD